jgi:hypothetical protein
VTLVQSPTLTASFMATLDAGPTAAAIEGVPAFEESGTSPIWTATIPMSCGAPTQRQRQVGLIRIGSV